MQAIETCVSWQVFQLIDEKVESTVEFMAKARSCNSFSCLLDRLSRRFWKVLEQRVFSEGQCEIFV